MHVLSSALCKLAKVQTNFCTLYRGVRGKLTPEQFRPDKFGIIAYIEYAFTSSTMKASIAEEFTDDSDISVIVEII